MQENDQEFSFRSLFVPFTTGRAIHFIILIGLVVFANGLFNNFVGDDHSQIVENPTIQSIQNLPTFFTGSTFYNGGSQTAGLYYRPLLSTFFSLIYTFFGLNYFAFHFFQILLHIINACLVFLLFKHFFKKPLSFVLSLIFLIHPINSEAALYISDTQEVLFFFFGMVSFLIIQRSHSKKSLILATIFLFMSLISKETGALFICLSLIYLFIYKRKDFYPFCWYSVGAFSFLVLLRIHAVGLFAQVGKNAPIETLNLWGRMLNMPAMFLFYIKTFLFPLTLATSYHWIYRQATFNNFFLPLLLDLVFIAVIITLGSIFYQKFSRKYFITYCFFSMWFFSGMLLHLQFFPLDRTVAERWFYFPIVGILGMMGVILEIFHFNVKNKWLVGLVIIIIALLATRTFIRSFDWRDEITLAIHDSKVSKQAYDLENVLSADYLKQGDFEAARVHASKSISLFPYMTNYSNLGAAYYSLGDYKSAKVAYIHALQYGNYYLIYDNLAFLFLVYGDPQQNINFIKERALQRYPQDAKLWLCLAILEYKYGNADDALIEIQKAYTYDKGQEVSWVYAAISNNKKLNIKIIDGKLTFQGS